MRKKSHFHEKKYNCDSIIQKRQIFDIKNQSVETLYILFIHIFGMLYQISKYILEIANVNFNLIFDYWMCRFWNFTGFFSISNSISWLDGVFFKFKMMRWSPGTPRCSFGQLCVDDCTTRAKVRIACKLIIYSSSSWKAADYNRIYIYSTMAYTNATCSCCKCMYTCTNLGPDHVRLTLLN